MVFVLQQCMVIYHCKKMSAAMTMSSTLSKKTIEKNSAHPILHKDAGGDITERHKFYYGILSRFITVYQGYHGNLLRILRDFFQSKWRVTENSIHQPYEHNESMILMLCVARLFLHLPCVHSHKKWLFLQGLILMCELDVHVYHIRHYRFHKHTFWRW